MNFLWHDEKITLKRDFEFVLKVVRQQLLDNLSVTSEELRCIIISSEKKIIVFLILAIPYQS